MYMHVYPKEFTRYQTHFLEIITKEATLKTNMVEPAWADFELGLGKQAFRKLDLDLTLY